MLSFSTIVRICNDADILTMKYNSFNFSDLYHIYSFVDNGFHLLGDSILVSKALARFSKNYS